MATGQGYAYHTGGAINRPIADGHMWAFYNGSWMAVRAAWAFSGTWKKWYPHGGYVPPGNVHVITLAGRHVSGHWSFSIPAAAHGHITHATVIITARSIWSGNVSGWPSGGTLASNVHIASGGGTVHRTVSAAPFNGATHGVTLHTTIGTTAAVTRVSLRITYHV